MKLNPVYTCCCLLMLCIVQAACIREDNDDCPAGNDEHVLTVHSFDGQGNELTGTGAVSEVMLYIFDAQNHFLQSISCKENETVPINYPEQEKIAVIGWGNSQSNNQTMPQPIQGTPLESLQMSLLHSGEGTLLSPDDLFYGSVNVDFSAATRVVTVTHQLNLQRKVAGMEIIVKGIPQRFETDDEDFTLQVNETAEGMDFMGDLTTSHNNYRPTCRFNSLKELIAPIFRTLPSGGRPVTVTLYKGNEPVYEASTNEEGTPFILEAGKLLSITIDLNKGAGGSASFFVNKWNESNINQEF